MLLIASYTLLEPGQSLVLRYQGSFIFDGQKPSQYVRHSSEDDLLESLSSFPTFSWFQSQDLCILSQSFSVTFVKVFWSDGTDTSISLQLRLAWSLVTISGLFTDSSLSLCICISQRIVNSSLLLLLLLLLL